MYSEERKAVKRNEESLLKVKSVLHSNVIHHKSKSSVLLLFTYGVSTESACEYFAVASDVIQQVAHIPVFPNINPKWPYILVLSTGR